MREGSEGAEVAVEREEIMGGETDTGGATVEIDIIEGKGVDLRREIDPKKEDETTGGGAEAIAEKGVKK
jgi:hypothetical protein